MKKGFSLIELLVSVFIITILASCVVVFVTQQKAKSRDFQRKADLLKTAQALEMFYSNYHKYPTFSDPNSPWVELNRLCNPVSTNSISQFIKDGCPSDPLNSSSYPYRYFATSNTYYLIALSLIHI